MKQRFTRADGTRGTVARFLELPVLRPGYWWVNSAPMGAGFNHWVENNRTDEGLTMATITDRYGATLRIFDNGGRSADRYTLIPPRWARDYRERDPGLWLAFACNSEPFHPQGIGMHCSAMPGPHLGKRVHWDTLPRDVQRAARQSFPEFCPKECNQ